MTNEKQIEFAIKFCGDNLDRYRAGDWLNLREDLKSFLGFLGATKPHNDAPMKIGFFMPGSAPLFDEMTEDDLRAIQTDARLILDMFIEPAQGITIRQRMPTVKITLDYASMRMFGHPFVTRHGATRDCVLGLLLRLIEHEKTTPVVRCPQCGMIFYRRGKQIFCGRTCTNRAMVQRKRAGNAKPRQAIKQKPSTSLKSRRAKQPSSAS